jgi:hypothetical protein
MDIMRDHTDDKDAAAFRVRLMEIAEAVALAFREEEHKSSGDRLRCFIEYLMHSLSRKTKGRRNMSYQEFLNISAAERRIIAALNAALSAD